MAEARAQPRSSSECGAFTSVSDRGVGVGVGVAAIDGGVGDAGALASSGGMVSTTSPLPAGARCADATAEIATIIPMSAARETTTAAALLHDRNHFATRGSNAAARASFDRCAREAHAPARANFSG
jgi:hypothetical protein